LIKEQVQHDTASLTQQAKILIAGLNTEQFTAFKTIVDTVLANIFGFYFVSGYGGTGKTYLTFFSYFYSMNYNGNIAYIFSRLLPIESHWST
jgi:hypothetical protein